VDRCVWSWAKVEMRPCAYLALVDADHFECSYPGCDDSIPEGGWVEVQINNNGVEDKIATLEASGKAKIAKERHVFGISVVCEYVTRTWCERVVESYKMVMKDLEGVKATVSAGDEQFRTFTSGKNERGENPGMKILLPCLFESV